MSEKPISNSLYWSPIRKKTKTEPPIRSLKKFCESLPASQPKPSGLNMIVWKKHTYSPNEKQKRLKLENETIKYRLAQQNTEQRKTLRRTRSKTQADQPFLGNYKQQFAKIKRRQLTTSLMSQEQEEVFANIKQESFKDEFKRNHKNVWKFIVSKKYPTEQRIFNHLIQIRQKNSDKQMHQMKSKLLKQKLQSYMKKWNPNGKATKPLFESMTTSFKAGASKSNTINF